MVANTCLDVSINIDADGEHDERNEDEEWSGADGDANGDDRFGEQTIRPASSSELYDTVQSSTQQSSKWRSAREAPLCSTPSSVKDATVAPARDETSQRFSSRAAGSGTATGMGNDKGWSSKYLSSRTKVAPDPTVQGHAGTAGVGAGSVRGIDVAAGNSMGSSSRSMRPDFAALLNMDRPQETTQGMSSAHMYTHTCLYRIIQIANC
jgi:hypothetical protein